MKKFGIFTILTLSILAAVITPASASVRVTAHVTPKVIAGRTQTVAFSAKTSRRGSVRVIVSRSSKVVRTLRAKRSGAAYTASWNLRTSTGTTVPAGVYAYKVAVTTKSSYGSTRGKIAVRPTGTTKSSRWIGFYIPGVPLETESLSALESQIATHAAVINFFISDWQSFPIDRVSNCAAHGSTPLITLNFGRTLPNKGVLDSILAGGTDEYLHHFAGDAKAYGGTVWLRPFPEMNGNWEAWCGVTGNNTTDKTVAAWRHVHDVLIDDGATNIKFVWNVNCGSVPNTTANALENYWPGSSYVDFVSIDGYNWGNHNPAWSSWVTPTDIFGDAYRRITTMTTKPLFIAEVASSSNGGDKAAWITDFFGEMGARFPRVKGVCWFNADKEEDWRVEQTPATTAAMRKICQIGY
jgi:beta-mannanase